MEIPVKLMSDEKGYFDRECPNEQCLYVFKVHMDDWTNKVSDDEVYCPRCGYTSPADQWWTQQQLEGIEEIALQFAVGKIQDTLDKSFKKMSKLSSKYFKVAYKPDKRISFENSPIGQREEWELEIHCAECGTRTSVIGSAFFCPCCGHNAVDRIFSESMARLQLQLSSLDEMRGMLVTLYGKDMASNMIHSLIESSLKEVVSAYQKFAVEVFRKGSDKNVRPNDFQMVEKGSDLFADHYGSGYEAWLSDDEIRFMIVMFQRRHILEHNNGIVDERYLKNSNDTVYLIGQRIVCKEVDVVKLISVIRMLAEGIAGCKRSCLE